MNFWDDHATPEGVFNPPAGLYDIMTRRQAVHIHTELDGASTILDLGCGIGRLTKAMWQIDPRLYMVGVDGSMPMLQEAARLEGNGRFVLAADRLPDGLPVLDGAFCVLLMQHIDDAIAYSYLWSLLEAIRPGGRLVVQWVLGDPAESHDMSHKRRLKSLRTWYTAAGWTIDNIAHDADVTGYSDEWVWITARKETT